jgi:hypothetical protein
VPQVEIRRMPCRIIGDFNAAPLEKEKALGKEG